MIVSHMYEQGKFCHSGDVNKYSQAVGTDVHVRIF